jgi:hypothetical protein
MEATGSVNSRQGLVSEVGNGPPQATPQEALPAKLYDGSWETPRLWHEDGSVADW